MLCGPGGQRLGVPCRSASVGRYLWCRVASLASPLDRGNLVRPLLRWPSWQAFPRFLDATNVCLSQWANLINTLSSSSSASSFRSDCQFPVTPRPSEVPAYLPTVHRTLPTHHPAYHSGPRARPRRKPHDLIRLRAHRLLLVHPYSATLSLPSRPSFKMGASKQALYFLCHPNQLRSIIQW